MAKKKHQLWWINRAVLSVVLFTARAAWSGALWMGKNAAKLTKRVTEAKLKKLESRTAAINKHKSGAVFSELVPEFIASGDYADFTSALYNRSQIILILGKRGSGKSALGFRLVENFHAKTSNPCFALGVRKDLLPKWISEISNLDEVLNDSIVIVDEGAVAFGSRESMQKHNVSLGKMLAIARHKNLTLVFITQNTGMIDKNVLNLTDIIISNEGSLLQKQMERPALKNFIEKSDSAFKKITKGERIKRSYIFSDDFEGLCRVALPSFWNEGISKSRA